MKMLRKFTFRNENNKISAFIQLMPRRIQLFTYVFGYYPVNKFYHQRIDI